MYKELACGIFQYDFPEDVAKETVKSLNKLSDTNWQQSLIGGGQRMLHIRSSEGYPLDQGMPQIATKIRQNFYSSVKHYTNFFNTSVVHKRKERLELSFDIYFIITIFCVTTCPAASSRTK